MDNNEFLAAQMTQTYFSIMSPEQKVDLVSNLTLYNEKYLQVYNACIKSIKEQEISRMNNINKPFGEIDSLNERIK